METLDVHEDPANVCAVEVFGKVGEIGDSDRGDERLTEWCAVFALFDNAAGRTVWDCYRQFLPVDNATRLYPFLSDLSQNTCREARVSSIAKG